MVMSPRIQGQCFHLWEESKLIILSPPSKSQPTPARASDAPCKPHALPELCWLHAMPAPQSKVIHFFLAAVPTSHKCRGIKQHTRITSQLLEVRSVSLVCPLFTVSSLKSRCWRDWVPHWGFSQNHCKNHKAKVWMSNAPARRKWKVQESHLTKLLYKVATPFHVALSSAP